jgi:hypothetical protein
MGSGGPDQFFGGPAGGPDLFIIKVVFFGGGYFEYMLYYLRVHLFYLSGGGEYLIY